MRLWCLCRGGVQLKFLVCGSLSQVSLAGTVGEEDHSLVCSQPYWYTPSLSISLSLTPSLQSPPLLQTRTRTRTHGLKGWTQSSMREYPLYLLVHCLARIYIRGTFSLFSMCSLLLLLYLVPAEKRDLPVGFEASLLNFCFWYRLPSSFCANPFRFSYLI